MNGIKSLFSVVGLIAAFSAGTFAQTPLATLDGGPVDIQAQKGKVVVLAVGAAWLPLSAKQVDFANQIAKKYAGKEVVVYFVATDSVMPKSRNFATNDDIRKFATQNRLNVQILRDPDGGATLRKFSVEQVPSFVILDKSGIKVGEALGGIDPKYDITVPISKVIDKIL